MPFQVSPKVNISEIDLTTVVPAVSTTEGAIAGAFRWGPVEQRVLVDSEDNLTFRFGKPTSHNPETFFTAANFLAYSNKLYVTRVIDGNTLSSVANTGTVDSPVIANHVVKNADSYDALDGTFDGDVVYIAKYPGAMGNSLKVSICDTANAYESNTTLLSTANVNSNTAETYINFTVGSNTASIRAESAEGTEGSDAVTALLADLTVGDFVVVGNSTIGTQTIKLSAKSNTTISTDGANNVGTATLSFYTPYQLGQNHTQQQVQRRWEYYNEVDRAPQTSSYLQDRNLTAVDELHVAVIDEDGLFTGNPGQVVEVFEAVSRATDAKTESGATNYYKDVINQTSSFVWWANDRSGATSAAAASVANSSNDAPLTLSFGEGADGANEGSISLANLLIGYDTFANAEEVDVSLILCGKARGSATTGVSTSGNSWTGLLNYIISNICEVRKDCVVYASPAYADVVNATTPTDNVIAFRNNVTTGSSYAVLDSGYKYQYDKYNDTYRYIPLNGDIAGLTARTDNVRDPWYSPAGLNRGQIKNVVKLAYNPSLANRDQLYKNDVNPVVTFPGQGTLLFGDKTLLGRPSAFDRINVRRLFIILEKAIATASQSILFEFNDEFTQANFKNIVEPFLRDVQGRRGITDYRVVADSTNNTAEVIDRNEFVGDIYIKPARSINFIQLNFVAVRTGVEFQEIVGNF